MIASFRGPGFLDSLSVEDERSFTSPLQGLVGSASQNFLMLPQVWMSQQLTIHCLLICTGQSQKEQESISRAHLTLKGDISGGVKPQSQHLGAEAEESSRFRSNCVNTATVFLFLPPPLPSFLSQKSDIWKWPFWEWQSKTKVLEISNSACSNLLHRICAIYMMLESRGLPMLQSTAYCLRKCASPPKPIFPIRPCKYVLWLIPLKDLPTLTSYHASPVFHIEESMAYSQLTTFFSVQ